MLDAIRAEIADVECLIEGLTMIGELEDQDRRRFNPAAVTMLWISIDKLRRVQGDLEIMHQTGGSARNAP